MVTLGILILVVVALASLAVVFRGGYPVRIDLHLFTVNTSARVVFLAGVIALGLAVFGLSLLWEGLKRGHRRRRETKELRKRAQANPPTQPGPPNTPPAADEHFDTTPRET
jgi:type VI protein secretion system component VasK